MIKINRVILIAFFLLALCGTACAGEESLLRKNWGRSVEAAKRAQIVNPEAGKVLRPMKSFDGKAAQSAVDGYHGSFCKEKSSKNYNYINLGNMSGVGAQ